MKLYNIFSLFVISVIFSGLTACSAKSIKSTNDLPNTDAVLRIFKEINGVPRPSQHEEKMVVFLENFAIEHKLEYVIDGKNVIMYKNATEGMEKVPGLILQGHMDMVAVHADDYDFDIYTQGVESEVVGEWMRSKDNKTSLGADDGIGISIMLAILESKTIKHGPLECLFTWDEEQEFSGAIELTPGILKSKYMMNIDWETDGELCIGTAGGVDVSATLNYEMIATPKDYAAYQLSINGVTGGHSGVAIVKGGANANKLMADFLVQQKDILLVTMTGGSYPNAITISSSATVLVPESAKETFEKEWKMYVTEATESYNKTDPDMKCTIKSVEAPAECVTAAHTKAIFAGLSTAPQGVTEWSEVVDNMFEVSNNVGPITMEDNVFNVEYLVRGFNTEGIDSLAAVVTDGYESSKVGFTTRKYGAFSPWNPDVDSSLMTYARNVYENTFGKAIGLRKVGGGLELSEFAVAYPDMEMISYGPTIVDPHTVNEKLEVKTIESCWDYTIELLRNFGTITGKTEEDEAEQTTEKEDEVVDEEEEEINDSDDEAVEVDGDESVIEEEDSADEATEINEEY
jgi:dipeptidase D